MNNDNNDTTNKVDGQADHGHGGGVPRASRRRRRDGLGRVAYSISEAARSLGMRPDALRRLVERHARAEGDEHVARLTGGIVARKRVGMGRWLVTVPPEMRGA